MPAEIDRRWLNGEIVGPLPADGQYVPVDKKFGGDGMASVSEKDLEFPDDGFEDLVEMRCLSDAELNRNLELMFHNNVCYCNCGPTLVAVNLFKFVPGIFDWEGVERYHGEPINSGSAPHAYKVANRMYGNLFQPGAKNQALVITGESGAGKSFTTNRILDYLAAIGRPSTSPRPPAFQDKAERAKAGRMRFEDLGITDKMLASTPILEAFGNAKMPRNNDSSRFGKLYKAYFNTEDKMIVGCSISPYLLEKSRVVKQGSCERGYHIFYEMIRGLSPEMAEEAKLQKPLSYYRYLNHPGIKPTYDVEEEVFGDDGRRRTIVKDDGMELESVLHAMNIFLGEARAKEVLKATSAVLQFGNIQMGGTKEKTKLDLSQRSLLDVTSLLGISPEAFNTAFSTMHLGRIKADVGPVMAIKFRDSLAKTIYNKQFEWLVESCSNLLSTDDRCGYSPFIGVLDIFGFEYVLDHNLNPPQTLNSFEQFCINLCNEKLQNLFVNIIFDMENQMYAEEGLGCVEIDFKRNDDTLAVLEGTHDSVYAQLDNVAGLSAKDTGGKDWDMTFYDGLKKLCKDRSRNKGNRIREAQMKEYKRRFGGKVPQGGFYVEHYAANVLYDVQDWNTKNTDVISGDIKGMMATCGLSFLAEIFTGLEGEKSPATTLKLFKQQLSHLVKDLCECETGFVRCIKPNREKKAEIYTSDLVLTQLAYTGMLSTLQIQKGGYSSRIPWDRFADEFRVLDVNAVGHVALVASIEALVPDILATMRHPPPEKQKDTPIFVGKKRCVLTRDWLYREIKAKANEAKGRAAVTVQAVYRSVAYSADYLARNQAVLGEAHLSAVVRGTLERLKYYESKWRWMPIASRSGLHRLLKATHRRQRYYNERKLEFEHINRQDIARHVYAFLQRQRYYEAKLAYAEGDKIAAERARFALYEGFTIEMNRDLLALEREAAQERWLMGMEEEYTSRIEDSKVLGKLQLAKEEEEALCEQQYNVGMGHYQRHIMAQEDQDRIDNHLATAGAKRLITGATAVVHQFLIDQGIDPSEGRYRYTAPRLKELPTDRENLIDMRAYYYGAAAAMMRPLDAGGPADGVPSLPPMMSIVNEATDRMFSGRLQISPTTARSPGSARGTPRLVGGASSPTSPLADPDTFTPRQAATFQRTMSDLLDTMRTPRGAK